MSVLEPRTAQTSLPIDYDKRLMLFTGRANPGLASSIADKLGVDLGPITLKTFANGEVYCRYGESIRGADVFIVQPTCGNPVTGVTANDALMELLVMIDAAVGASAHRVIAVTPWFAYSRQDKKSAPREPISARLVAHMLEAAGADRVLTMDLHAGQVQGFFDKPVDHMTAQFMLTQYFADLRLPDLVVVAPDVGRAKLNQKFAERIGADLAILTKDRRGASRRRDRLPDRRRRPARRPSSSTTSSTPAAPCGPRARRCSKAGFTGSSPPPPTPSSRATPSSRSLPSRSSRSWSPTPSPPAAAPPGTSSSSPAPTS